MSALPQQVLLNFRNMDFSDLNEVYEAECASYAVPWTKDVFVSCIQVGHECWVLCDDDEIVGYLLFANGAGECHLLNICIAPPQQGNGYGRELLRFMMDRAAIAGVHRVFLEVNVSNRLAIRLYQSEGYDEIGLRKNYYPTPTGREHALVMARNI